MIVDSMTHREVYAELAKERDNVTAWWRHQLEGMRRPVLKSKTFPIHAWRDYTSPRKNRYLFFTRIFDRRMKVILTGLAVIRRMSDGMTVYTSWTSGHELVNPMVIIPHAWKRYVERAGVNKTGIELLKHFFTHNALGADSHKQDVAGRSVRWNGEEHLATCVTDGVLLGQKDGNIFLVKTFITYDMAMGKQRKEFEFHRKRIMTDMEMYEEAMKYYNW